MYCKFHKESFGAFHSQCPSCRIEALEDTPTDEELVKMQSRYIQKLEGRVSSLEATLQETAESGFSPTRPQLDAAVKSSEEHLAKAAHGDLGSFD